MFDKSKKDNSHLLFVKHHIDNYNGDLPVWVAVEIMTMGNMHKLYNNLTIADNTDNTLKVMGLWRR